MKLVPVSAVPAQSFGIVLASQNCNISIYQKADTLYMSLARDSTDIVRTRACRNGIRILLDAQYHGFVGDFVFVDTQGDTQPQYLGLGTRYVLLYLEAADLV